MTHREPFGKKGCSTKKVGVRAQKLGKKDGMDATMERDQELEHNREFIRTHGTGNQGSTFRGSQGQGIEERIEKMHSTWGGVENQGEHMIPTREKGI